MGYYIDLKSLSLDAYAKKLEKAYLPPSRMMLKEGLKESFDCFKNMGINNIQELLLVLKKKDKMLELSKKESLSVEYLTLLLREIKSNLPNPQRLKDFKGISKSTIAILEKNGIKNTRSVYEKVKTGKNRKEFSKKFGINESEILELTKLTDLSRIKWVGATFARMLYDLDIDKVEKVKKADPEFLHKEINRINQERNYYRGKIGLNDIKIVINAAMDVPVEIEY